jgi:hypothetical protein
MMRLALRRTKVTFFPIASVEISKSKDTISLFTVTGGAKGNPTSVEPLISPIFRFCGVFGGVVTASVFEGSSP